MKIVLSIVCTIAIVCGNIAQATTPPDHAEQRIAAMCKAKTHAQTCKVIADLNTLITSTANEDKATRITKIANFLELNTNGELMAKVFISQQHAKYHSARNIHQTSDKKLIESITKFFLFAYATSISSLPNIRITNIQTARNTNIIRIQTTSGPYQKIRSQWFFQSNHMRYIIVEGVSIYQTVAAGLSQKIQSQFQQNGKLKITELIEYIDTYLKNTK